MNRLYSWVNIEVLLNKNNVKNLSSLRSNNVNQILLLFIITININIIENYNRI